ncbi:hypothetical protein OED01_05430 [Microbacterium sp. M28]|uniref:hypothetical protein n=1 Tax=Microbacterium sp. M28 TaxID=2962064 RepID=UPI0021F443FD|nr:hypothetical protein [Microbacterium sp. M28]UYO98152.1 hypothetical protein OED01_05430 [Microbacterium sp. M28]
MPRIARILTVFVAALAVTVGTVIPVSAATAQAGVGAASISRAAADPAATGIVKTTLVGFKPGNIISDAVFTNNRTMTEAQIQAFLNSKVPKCRTGLDSKGRPIVCLKDLRITTKSKAADKYCAAYGGAASEPAARIILKVAQACGINPQVLIVMLQKEQGLITHTYPSPERYAIAMGFNCPDTAPCDPGSSGFFTQLYGGARQMQLYMEGRYFTWYAPGKTWNIRYDVEVSCGSSPVYVANKATSALYYYTPYQPNAAALRAGYGAAEPCGAYGNRNFYNYFTDWFGPTQYNLRAPILKAWEALGGVNGTLGVPVGAEKSVSANGGGYVQEFQRGSIWLQAASTTAFAIGNGPLRSSYLSSGGPAGSWGWPASIPRCGMVDGGCLTVFQKGTVGYSPTTGAVLVPATIAAEWNRVGAAVMGYPAAAARCGLIDSGCLQAFLKGTVGYSAATGAVFIPSEIAAEWNRVGAVAMGYPTAAARCGLVDDGCLQAFQKGTVGYSAATGAVFIPSEIAAEWNRVGAVAMGYPTAAARCGLVEGGCLQAFQRATVGYSPATGAFSMTPAIAAGWNKLGAVAIGYPNRAGETISANGGGDQQQFTRATLWASKSGAFAMGDGAFRNNYLAAGGPAGSWGWPAGQPRCGLADGGCLMVFQHGTVGYSPSTGSVLMSPPVAAEWNRKGIARLGYPAAAAQTFAANGGGERQAFTRATLFASDAGVVAMMPGVLLDRYVAAGGPTGSWGWPVSEPRCGLPDSGCLMVFQNGTVGYSASTGAVLMSAPVAAEWNRVGISMLGYPVSTTKPGIAQMFSKGAVTSGRLGAFAIPNGGFLDAYIRTGGAAGAAGEPTGRLRCGLISGGCLLASTNGTLAFSAATGLQLIPPPLAVEWNRRGVTALGYPIEPARTDGTVTTQRFQRATVSYDSATKTITVR